MFSIKTVKDFITLISEFNSFSTDIINTQENITNSNYDIKQSRIY